MKRLLHWLFNSRSPSRRRTFWFIKVSLAVALLWALKRMAHTLGIDLLPIAPPLLSLVLVTLVLLCLLLYGVLSDYKESERIPASLATHLELLSLQIQAAAKIQPAVPFNSQQQPVIDLAEAFFSRMHARISNEKLHYAYRSCLEHVLAVAAARHEDPGLTARLMRQLEAILELINRVEVIRRTEFVSSVYWLAYAGTGFTCLALVLTRIESPLESALFLFVVSFVLLYLVFLIRDLDNPFGYNDDDSAEDVSLEPLMECIDRLKIPLAFGPSD